MSDKRTNERGRRLRFRRRLRGEKKAVSPVVATLILILIAVAAAAALYLWLVAWQGGVTKGIGSPGAQYTVTIGGSTSVYPFDQVAVAQFEANNSDVVISNNQGGTGAGMIAVCQGSIDIGASSSLQTVSGLMSTDNCPSTTVITTVAYDAVDIITSSAANSPTTVASGVNTGPLLSMNATVLLAIYADVSSSTTTIHLGTGVTTWLGTLWNPGAGVNWNAVPQTAGCGQTDATLAAAFTAHDCNPVNLAHAIDTVSRSDASGTTQSFEARLLGATSATAVATSLSQLGFSGCGSNNLLADCGIATTKTGNGNPGVISAVAADPNAIGYASDGLARTAGSGVAITPFAAPGQTCAALTGYPSSQVSNCGVIPTTGGTGTISAGIKSSATTANYAGWRPFEYVTTDTPTGEVARFINYVLDPANNINFASESAEVSIYSI